MLRPSTPTSLLIALIALGCSLPDDVDRSPDDAADRSAAATTLGPAEVFAWGDQPIAFRPPAEGWTREREQSGGLTGVRFVRIGSGGERIHVAEFRAVGERDRCSEILSLRDALDTLSPREFATRLQRARPYAAHALSEVERDAFDDAAAALGEARTAYAAGDLETVRDRLDEALRHLARVDYTLEEVVAPALFTGEGYEAIGRVSVSDPVDIEVAGEPARAIDYTLAPSDRDRTLQGRERYVEYENHLFVASFQGFEESLPLFEALVDSIAFEPGPCAD
ncbi:MAG: hypothetical protein R3F35_14970 [Myxococcota bacterium]